MTGAIIFRNDPGSTAITGIPALTDIVARQCLRPSPLGECSSSSQDSEKHRTLLTQCPYARLTAKFEPL